MQLSFITLTHYRSAVLWVMLISLGGTLASLGGQYILDMNPCVMCIQQRLALIAVFILSLVAWFFPLGQTRAKWTTSIMMGLPALYGFWIAIKQIRLQNLPLHKQPSCGAPWTFRWRDAPLFDLYEPIIRGTGACGEVQKILGLSLPTWSAAFFGLILLILAMGVLTTNNTAPDKFI